MGWMRRPVHILTHRQREASERLRHSLVHLRYENMRRRVFELDYPPVVGRDACATHASGISYAVLFELSRQNSVKGKSGIALV